MRNSLLHKSGALRRSMHKLTGLMARAREALAVQGGGGEA